MEKGEHTRRSVPFTKIIYCNLQSENKKSALSAENTEDGLQQRHTETGIPDVPLHSIRKMEG